jgi:hypothetical protein
MMKAPELLALEADLSDSSRVPEEDLARLFDEGQKYLLSQYSFLANRSYQKSTVTTWSRQTLFLSSIMKFGNEEEKARANAQKNRWNRPHSTKRKRTLVQQTLF